MKRVYEDDEDDSLTIAQMGDGFPEKLKRSRYIRTRRSVRSEIEKGKIGDCGGSASREVLLDDLFDNELVKRKNETVVVTREIKQEEADTGSKAANENNSLDPPLVETVVSPHKTRQNCDYEVNLSGTKAEKKKKRTMVGDGTKEAKCLLHEGGDNQFKMEDDDDADERLKQRNNAINEIALTLEARMMKLITEGQWEFLQLDDVTDEPSVNSSFAAV
uniref:Uncharacterized protein n=1 Tax=Brassica campestris TaxID=3711 RepID=M4DCS2_BRACM